MGNRLSPLLETSDDRTKYVEACSFENAPFVDRKQKIRDALNELAIFGNIKADNLYEIITNYTVQNRIARKIASIGRSSRDYLQLSLSVYFDELNLMVEFLPGSYIRIFDMSDNAKQIYHAVHTVSKTLSPSFGKINQTLFSFDSKIYALSCEHNMSRLWEIDVKDKKHIVSKYHFIKNYELSLCKELKVCHKSQYVYYQFRDTENDPMKIFRSSFGSIVNLIPDNEFIISFNVDDSIPSRLNLEFTGVTPHYIYLSKQNHAFEYLNFVCDIRNTTTTPNHKNREDLLLPILNTYPNDRYIFLGYTANNCYMVCRSNILKPLTWRLFIDSSNNVTSTKPIITTTLDKDTTTTTDHIYHIITPYHIYENSNKKLIDWIENYDPIILNESTYDNTHNHYARMEFRSEKIIVKGINKDLLVVLNESHDYDEHPRYSSYKLDYTFYAIDIVN